MVARCEAGGAGAGAALCPRASTQVHPPTPTATATATPQPPRNRLTAAISGLPATLSITDLGDGGSGPRCSLACAVRNFPSGEVVFAWP